MSSVKVTKRDAEKVLAAVRKQFSAYVKGGSDLDQPMLIKDWDFFGHGAVPYAIVWEGGPYEWAHLVGGGVDEEFGFRYESAPIPDNVYVEPYTSYVLAIYPKN